MKTLNYTKIIKLKLLSIITLIMLTQSCSKDTNCGDTSDVVNNYFISADDKAKIPFKGNDTLVYISDAGDTATLIGEGKNTWTEQKITNISGGDCAKNQIDKKETISIECNGNNNELNKILYKISGNKERTLIEYVVNTFYSNDYPYYFNSDKFYTDSTLINSIFYPGVLIDNVNYKALYNFNYGFLKIEFKGGKIWLLKIKKL
jgi:hypothetical protein